MHDFDHDELLIWVENTCIDSVFYNCKCAMDEVTLASEVGIAHLEERISKDFDRNVAGSIPLCASIFPPSMFAFWHTSIQLETNTKND